MITITVNNKTYTYNETLEQREALTSEHAKTTSELVPSPGQPHYAPFEERLGYIENDEKWLQSLIQEWADNNPDEDIDEALDRCLNSWVGIAKVAQAKKLETKAPITVTQHKNSLIHYANRKYAMCVSHGTVTANDFKMGTDSASRAELLHDIQYMRDNQIPALNWQGNSATPITLDQLVALHTAIAMYLQIAKTTKFKAIEGIQSGKYKKRKEIDELLWPQPF